MVQSRKDRKAQASNIKLKQPDRSAPTEETLLDFAHERDLFKQADARQRTLRKAKTKDTEDDAEEEEDAAAARIPATVDRVMETVLWSVTLAMLHFTLDVLVQHQYAVEISWPTIITRAFRALAGEWRLLLLELAQSG